MFSSRVCLYYSSSRHRPVTTDTTHQKSLWPFPDLIVDAWKIQIISGIYFAAEEAAEHDIKILTLLLTHICLLGMCRAVEPSEGTPLRLWQSLEQTHAI